MKPRRNALGRGLDSVFAMTDIRTDGGSAISEINVADIMPNPQQPRTNFEPTALEELATSIRELGIVQPLSLRKMPDATYQIIAGERRWRAAKLAGLSTVPAYVRTASDTEVTEMALIENIQREDLNAIEVALAFRKLIDTYNLTQERLSERIGKKRATIANHLRLLKLPAEIQIGLRDKKLEMGHARALLAIDNPKRQLQLYSRIVKEGLSVRKVEELVRNDSDEPKGNTVTAPQAAALAKSNLQIKNKLQSKLPTPVAFTRKPDGKGAITLRFGNDSELQKLLDILDCQQ